MKVLTQKVKNKADKKWSFRAENVKEAETWMSDIGCQYCSLCEMVGNDTSTGKLNCDDCLLNDSKNTCCKEYHDVVSALYSSDIIVAKDIVKNFNAACKAMQNRIKNLKVG